MDTLEHLLDKYPYRVVALILSLNEYKVLRVAFNDGTYEIFSKKELSPEQVNDLKQGLNPRDLEIIDV